MDSWISILGLAAGLALTVMVFPHQVRTIRIVGMVAGLLGLGYFLASQGIGVAAAIALGFVVVNGSRLMQLYQRARSGAMSGEERKLFDHVMKIEDPSQQSRLCDLMEWQDIESGAQLIEEGELDPPLIYVASGSADIIRKGERIGECGQSEFLGEMSHVSGHRASAGVVACEAMRIARFDRDALGQLTRSLPEVGKAVDIAVNRSLAAKVMRMNQASQ